MSCVSYTWTCHKCGQEIFGYTAPWCNTCQAIISDKLRVRHRVHDFFFCSDGPYPERALPVLLIALMAATKLLETIYHSTPLSVPIIGLIAVVACGMLLGRSLHTSVGQ